jgi:hypothetical protein
MDCQLYTIAWKPPVPGLYNVKPTFGATDSYFGSEAGTSFFVKEPTINPAVITPTPSLPHNIRADFLTCNCFVLTN